MKSKRQIALIRSILIVLLIAGLTWVSARAKPTPAAKPIVLRFAVHVPPTHWQTTEGYKRWSDLVTNRTDGRVKVELYPGETLINARDMFDGVAKKVVDVAMVPTPYEPKRMSLYGVWDLAFAGADYRTMFTALKEIRPIAEKQMLQYGVKPLWTTITGQLAIWTTKKQVKTLEDLKGLKIRGLGGLYSVGLDKLGAVSVSMPAPEVYTALERGTVDGGLYSYGSFIEVHLYEVTKYGTIFAKPWTPCGAVIINVDVWNSIPEKDQKVILDVSREVEDHFADFLTKEEARYFNEIEKKGLNLYKLPPAEMARWVGVIKPLLDKWLTDNGAPGQEIWAIRKKYIRD